MININLLPWREQEDKQKKEAFKVVLIAEIAITIFIIILMYFLIGPQTKMYQHQKSLLQQEVNVTNVEITELSDVPTKKEAIQVKLNTYKLARQSGQLTLDILEVIGENIPKELTLQRVIRNNLEVTLIGHSPTNEKINDFIDSLAKQAKFSRTTLKESKFHDEDDDNKAIKFELDIVLAEKKDTPKQGSSNASKK